MPRDGSNTAATHMCQQLFSDSGEGYAVQTLGIAHFNTSKLKAHDSGVIATDGQHIRAAAVPLPAEAIERVVLMTEHDATGTEVFQTPKQALSAMRTRRVERLN